MSTYPVDIKSTTASGVATHNAGGTAGPGRAFGFSARRTCNTGPYN